MGVTVTKSSEAEWSHPRLPDGLTPDQLERAVQVRRQGLADGDGGFFASRVVMPAGLVTDPHHHDHSELIVVLSGSMAFDDGTATRRPHPERLGRDRGRTHLRVHRRRRRRRVPLGPRRTVDIAPRVSPPDDSRTRSIET